MTWSRTGRRFGGAIGAALQEAALDPYLTGTRAPATPDGDARHHRRGRQRRSDELLTRVGLTEAADRKVKGYSGGMKRRLDLALALVHRPRILFLDEPTTGLDPQSRSALWVEVGRLAKEEGVTVFLTTQYLEEADVLADRVGIIDHGRIVAEGTPEAAQGGDRLLRPSKPCRRTPPTGVQPQPCSSASASHDRLQPGQHRRSAHILGRQPRGHRPRAGRRGRPHLAPPDPRSDPRRRLPRQDRPSPRGRRGAGSRAGTGRGSRARARVTGAAVLQMTTLGRRAVIRTARSRRTSSSR